MGSLAWFQYKDTTMECVKLRGFGDFQASRNVIKVPPTSRRSFRVCSQPVGERPRRSQWDCLDTLNPCSSLMESTRDALVVKNHDHSGFNASRHVAERSERSPTEDAISLPKDMAIIAVK